MDKETFVPPETESIKKSVNDFQLLKEAINAYFSLNFKAMKGIILEYGEENFFKDLSIYFTQGYWRIPANKYATFAGMTIAFFIIYE
jgi:hypothetical protein